MFAQFEFDDQAVVHAVMSLGAPQRTAFAAACAERLLPSYEAFARVEGWGAPQLLREGLDVAWAFARSSAAGEMRGLLAGTSADHVRELCDAVVRVTPDAAGTSMELRALAIGAAACVVCALRAGGIEGGSAESAILAAMTARETIVLSALGDDAFASDDEHYAAVVEARSLKEVVQQGRDLALLARARRVTADTIAELKASATRLYTSGPPASLIVPVDASAAAMAEIDAARVS